MSAIIEEALACYEKAVRKQNYLAGWTKFQRADPQGFSEYLAEAAEIESGFADIVPE
jgi:hypothetical protein